MQIKPRPGAIREYLKAEDISRDELARRIGVDRVTAYRVESDVSDPSPKFIAGFLTLTGGKFEDYFVIVDAA